MTKKKKGSNYLLMKYIVNSLIFLSDLIDYEMKQSLNAQLTIKE